MIVFFSVSMVSESNQINLKQFGRIVRSTAFGCEVEIDDQRYEASAIPRKGIEIYTKNPRKLCAKFEFAKN